MARRGGPAPAGLSEEHRPTPGRPSGRHAGGNPSPHAAGRRQRAPLAAADGQMDGSAGGRGRDVWHGRRPGARSGAT
eukprot:7566593-Alexandrium_andersonii.AAC.1